MPQTKNTLLGRLDPQSAEQIHRHLKTIELRHGEVLANTHQRIQRVYFPHSGIISCVVDLKNGMGIETGMIGNDGQYGAGQALDDKLALNRVLIQVAGTASAIDADRLREITDANPPLRKLLIGYEQFFVAQVQQTAACNASHDVQTRMSKWLLRMHDLTGVDLPLTQEFIAQMMGVQRTSVSGVAADMQKAGLIAYSRGHVRIVDIEKVRARACECHDAITSHYKAIFG